MSTEDRERKYKALKEMIRIVNSQASSKGYVALLKYYIDTEAYAASALTLSQDYTPNLHETPNGFGCETFFSPDMLAPEERQGKEIINGVVRVNLYVNLDDIVAIVAETEKDKSVPLYSPGDE